MRTALILLFLLAVASLPGALLPQWSLNSGKTAQYIADHPTLGPWLDRLGFFEVFASPWYAAIYLLLFTSLVGCLAPRTWEFAGQLRARPVATPRNLGRLPHHDRREVPGSVDEVADRVTAGLRGWRIARRVEERPGQEAVQEAGQEAAGQEADTIAVTISGEKGFLRELGNLVFHFSLLGLLVAIAIGKMVGYEGSVIVNVGAQFCSASPASYDNFRPGLLVDGTDMSPFCLDVRSFAADYTQVGQAISFVAEVGSQSGARAGTDSWNENTLQVNDPLRLEGERVYLIGHGYTPHFQVSFPDGTVRDYAQPFAPDPQRPELHLRGSGEDPRPARGHRRRRAQTPAGHRRHLRPDRLPARRHHDLQLPGRRQPGRRRRRVPR